MYLSMHQLSQHTPDLHSYISKLKTRFNWSDVSVTGHHLRLNVCPTALHLPPGLAAEFCKALCRSQKRLWEKRFWR